MSALKCKYQQLYAQEVQTQADDGISIKVRAVAAAKLMDTELMPPYGVCYQTNCLAGACLTHSLFLTCAACHVEGEVGVCNGKGGVGNVDARPPRSSIAVKGAVA